MNSSSPDSAAVVIPSRSAGVETFALGSPHEDSRPRASLPPPLRRSSPRLFREVFNAMPDTASRRQATLPYPVSGPQDPLQSVSRALQSVNQALQDAQQAFHQPRRPRSESEGRSLRTEGETAEQLVDLTTTSSPSAGSAESHYISYTTHPHDSSQAHRTRRFNALNEPIYPNPTQASSPRRSHTFDHELPHPRANVRFWPPYRFGSVRLPRIRPLGEGQLPSAVEEEAVNRQRENHSNWERTQARNMERQRIQEQSQDQDSSQHSSQSTMSPPSSSHTRPTTQSSRQRASTPQLENDPLVDEVDLTAVDDRASLSAALSKQREDAILAQNPGTDAGRTPLTAYKCPVCMDTPTDATSTVCGHVFCHRCIVDTLNWSIDQRREDAPASRKVKGVCPVCRKPLDLKDTPGTGRSLVPLELRLLVKKRKRDGDADTGKAKVTSVVKAERSSDDEEMRSGKGKAGKARKRERESTEDAIWRVFTNDNDNT
ncbi:hypothetical protein G647_07808 [Cladophialophora carrionii CBS 160.54]|uniref:RING-type domain-containing protein n=1 Tax=Cladophialophora carrionii CBS 160.54 TaxID=1279043 RepID=V9D491_9EURO|nr:uncharacterized protein G647_07808 [Cladophialophora carrionii CBS 160.54]ETI21461.1 hypothetical protein G647_07808 [Cladophialophora carrionii CBS 160.54]